MKPFKGILAEMTFRKSGYHGDLGKENILLIPFTYF